MKTVDATERARRTDNVARSWAKQAQRYDKSMQNCRSPAEADGNRTRLGSRAAAWAGEMAPGRAGPPERKRSGSGGGRESNPPTEDRPAHRF